MFDLNAIMYFKFISQEVGYGVFSKKKLDSGTLIGEYSGIIRENCNDQSYSWEYKTKIKQLKDVNLIYKN